MLFIEVKAEVCAGTGPEAGENRITCGIIDETIRAVVIEVGARGVEVEIEVAGGTECVIEAIICAGVVVEIAGGEVVEDGSAIELCLKLGLETINIIGALTESRGNSGTVKLLNVNGRIVLGGAEIVEAIEKVNLSKVEGGNVAIDPRQSGGKERGLCV